MHAVAVTRGYCISNSSMAVFDIRNLWNDLLSQTRSTASMSLTLASGMNIIFRSVLRRAFHLRALLESTEVLLMHARDWPDIRRRSHRRIQRWLGE